MDTKQYLKEVKEILDNLSDEEFIKLVEESNERIYVIPVQDKPLKLVFEELPCPRDSDIRCKYAKNTSKDMMFEISCSNFENCDKFD